MSEECCIIITTFADDDNGRQIIDALLEQRLAACVQVMPMQSCCRWQGRVCRDAEKLVLIKTMRALHAKVQEIIQVPITDGFSGYLDWMRQECG